MNADLILLATELNQNIRKLQDDNLQDDPLVSEAIKLLQEVKEYCAEKQKEDRN